MDVITYAAVLAKLKDQKQYADTRFNGLWAAVNSLQNNMSKLTAATPVIISNDSPGADRAIQVDVTTIVNYNGESYEDILDQVANGRPVAIKHDTGLSICVQTAVNMDVQKIYVQYYYDSDFIVEEYEIYE